MPFKLKKTPYTFLLILLLFLINIQGYSESFPFYSAIEVFNSKNTEHLKEPVLKNNSCRVILRAIKNNSSMVMNTSQVRKIIFQKNNHYRDFVVPLIWDCADYDKPPVLRQNEFFKNLSTRIQKKAPVKYFYQTHDGISLPTFPIEDNENSLFEAFHNLRGGNLFVYPIVSFSSYLDKTYVFMDIIIDTHDLDMSKIKTSMKEDNEALSPEDHFPKDSKTVNKALHSPKIEDSDKKDTDAKADTKTPSDKKNTDAKADTKAPSDKKDTDAKADTKTPSDKKDADAKADAKAPSDKKDADAKADAKAPSDKKDTDSKKA